MLDYISVNSQVVILLYTELLQDVTMVGNWVMCRDGFSILYLATACEFKFSQNKKIHLPKIVSSGSHILKYFCQVNFQVITHFPILINQTNFQGGTNSLFQYQYQRDEETKIQKIYMAGSRLTPPSLLNYNRRSHCPTHTFHQNIRLKYIMLPMLHHCYL